MVTKFITQCSCGFEGKVLIGKDKFSEKAFIPLVCKSCRDYKNIESFSETPHCPDCYNESEFALTLLADNFDQEGVDIFHCSEKKWSIDAEALICPSCGGDEIRIKGRQANATSPEITPSISESMIGYDIRSLRYSLD